MAFVHWQFHQIEFAFIRYASQLRCARMQCSWMNNSWMNLLKFYQWMWLHTAMLCYVLCICTHCDRKYLEISWQKKICSLCLFHFILSLSSILLYTVRADIQFSDHWNNKKRWPNDSTRKRKRPGTSEIKHKIAYTAHIYWSCWRLYEF